MDLTDIGSRQLFGLRREKLFSASEIALARAMKIFRRRPLAAVGKLRRKAVT